MPPPCAHFEPSMALEHHGPIAQELTGPIEGLATPAVGIQPGIPKVRAYLAWHKVSKIDVLRVAFRLRWRCESCNELRPAGDGFHPRHVATALRLELPSGIDLAALPENPEADAAAAAADASRREALPEPPKAGGYDLDSVPQSRRDALSAQVEEFALSRGTRKKPAHPKTGCSTIPFLCPTLPPASTRRGGKGEGGVGGSPAM